MTRRKSLCLKWTLVLLVVIVCPPVYTRPQEISVATKHSAQIEISTQAPIRDTQQKVQPDQAIQPVTPSPETSARDVKTKAPIRESIEMVAIQLLDKPNTTAETTVITDTRIPPKLKTQIKHRIKTRNENSEELENAHPGEAVPVTMDELNTEEKISEAQIESSTSNEGISTWISLSNPVKENSTTDSSKVEEATKKPKPTSLKNKPKRPQNNKVPKRPIIGSTNKADLVASGSAINANVYNKIKDTVLSNVQKNKNTSARPTSTTSTTTTTTTTTTTEAPTTKIEMKTPALTPVITVTSKPKKKNKNKQKTTTTLTPPVIDDSALLPPEAKEQEIELEVSTPPTTTKKPKRNSTRKKNKTKKRKTSKPKPSTEVAVSDVKTANKTKTNKNAKKPAAPTGAITTQIYNYLSREVMPSVGVGMLGLASLVGIAGYFLYPFATPVRRTFEVDKNDDLYKNNAEEYANVGNGQAEEEMLGTVLAGMPAHAKQKLNPYAAQTTHINRYPVKNEQDIRYRQVATGYNPNPNYGKVHYAQQKTGIAHAAVYARPINYSPQYETRHAYTTEGKYNSEKAQQPNYTPYPAVEPIYAAPQTGPSGVSTYENENSNSVVYGVKPAAESDFKPVYPFEGQFFSETTGGPVTYPPTSMYLGSNNDEENQDDNKYEENASGSDETGDNKFVVGNIPKELVESATPAVVPEHGPRMLRKKRSISGSLEELLAEKENNKEIFISNEIDDTYNFNGPIRSLALSEPDDVTVLPKDITTVYAISEPAKEGKTTEAPTTDKIEVVESVSTIPINNKNEKTTETSNDMETTTKTFKVYEVFPISNTDVTERNSPIYLPTSTVRSMITETTTELKLETTSSRPIRTSISVSTDKPAPTSKPNDPEVITYPPLNQQGGFFAFLQRLVDFKFRLGLGILQTTVDALNGFRDDTMKKIANSSRTHKG